MRLGRLWHGGHEQCGNDTGGLESIPLIKPPVYPWRRVLVPFSSVLAAEWQLALVH